MSPRYRPPNEKTAPGKRAVCIEKNTEQASDIVCPTPNIKRNLPAGVSHIADLVPKVLADLLRESREAQEGRRL